MKRRRGWRPILALGAAVSLLLSAFVAMGTPAFAAVQCQVDYAKNDWGSGFTANITIHNLGDALNGWTMRYAYAGNQQLQNGWNGTWAQSGQNVTVTNASWNGSLATGASTMASANFGYSGTNSDPTSFSVNNINCTGAHTAPTVRLTSPAPGATFTSGGTIGLAATTGTSDGATVSKVEFYNDTTLVGTDTSSPYSFNWTNVPAGDYSLTAKVYDSQNGTGVSEPVGVHVASGPSIAFTASALTVQQGNTGTIGVKLSSQPSSNVSVTVARTSGNTGLTVQSGSTLTFTSSNWSTAQNATIAANSSGTGNAVFTASATGYASATVTVTELAAAGDYETRFLALYDKITNPANGYFSPQGVPYHSVETLIVEAPDYGHETTSEGFSYMIWLQAMYGKVTSDWSKFNAAWATMEQFMIPQHADQPTNSFYNASSPATYAPESDLPEQYPSPIDSGVSHGSDPIASELQSAYGTSDIYGMHWLADGDNKYGYGGTPGGGCERGPTASGQSYINSYQRGPQESVFETIPQPSCDNFTYGGPNGYLDLFIKDSSYAKQWKYTDAPDADARAIQAAYWADTWAKAQNKGADVAATVGKAGKMGDYLRYSFFDKYFKQIGNCTSPQSCPAVTSGRGAEHYLLSWYYAWGGALDSSGGWAWRIGDGAAHSGYQNPMAAYALVNNTVMRPKSTTGVQDWTTSLQRQLEFYRWLQSNEGAIAGGATNSWGGHYGTPPAGDPTFHGMFYDSQPVYHDPPSNQWFGFQAWSMERVAEYYNVSGDATAKAVLDKWVAWAMANTTLNSNGTWQVPSTLHWTGQPDTWNPSSPGANTGLHVTIADFTNDVGVTAAYAKTLAYYAARAGNTQAQTMAKGLLDDMWALNASDPLGVSVTETRSDYNRLDDPFSTSTPNHDGVFVPSGWSGKMPNGDPINSSSTFLSIRSWYRQDPAWSKVQSYLNGGAAPTFNYHRFWAEADIAMAMGAYGELFGE